MMIDFQAGVLDFWRGDLSQLDLLRFQSDRLMRMVSERALEGFAAQTEGIRKLLAAVTYYAPLSRTECQALARATGAMIQFLEHDSSDLSAFKPARNEIDVLRMCAALRRKKLQQVFAE